MFNCCRTVFAINCVILPHRLFTLPSSTMKRGIKQASCFDIKLKVPGPATTKLSNDEKRTPLRRLGIPVSIPATVIVRSHDDCFLKSFYSVQVGLLNIYRSTRIPVPNNPIPNWLHCIVVPSNHHLVYRPALQFLDTGYPHPYCQRDSNDRSTWASSPRTAEWRRR